MSYLVLARKYRPQTFDDVVEQSHVTQTLRNAITANRVPHALLFCGPRGTGKTTIARILAKAMNCADGPTPSPCNTCRSCREITSSHSADVFEIDGASNNSVDQIRELRDNIKYMPTHGAFKIYIIDEVHMLSISAFNALLKTLEEPPTHVLFMFATTEPHKIPLTILSRCQRHDLKRVGIDGIQAHMRSIVNQENIRVDDQSLFTIATESDGCVRDALSLLDQVISCSDGDVTHESMMHLLGIIDRQVMFDISQAVFAGNISAILDIIDAIHERGQDIKKFYARLISHFRNLLVIKIGRQPDKLPDIPEHEKPWISDQIKSVPAPFLSQVLDILFKEESVIRFSDQPKLALEMVFIKLLQIKPVLSIDTLIEKLDALKGDLAGAMPEQRVSPVTPAVAAPSAPAPQAPASHPSADMVPRHPAAHPTPDPTPHDRATPSPGPQSQRNLSQAPPPNDNAAPDPTAKPGEPIHISWQHILEILERNHPPIGACLKKSALKKISDQSMELEVFGTNYEINRVRNDKSMVVIRKVFRAYFEKKVDVIILARPNDDTDYQTKRDLENELRREAKSHPLVEEAIKTLNPKQINIKILQEM